MPSPRPATLPTPPVAFTTTTVLHVGHGDRRRAHRRSSAASARPASSTRRAAADASTRATRASASSRQSSKQLTANAQTGTAAPNRGSTSPVRRRSPRARRPPSDGGADLGAHRAHDGAAFESSASLLRSPARSRRPISDGRARRSSPRRSPHGRGRRSSFRLRSAEPTSEPTIDDERADGRTGSPRPPSPPRSEHERADGFPTAEPTSEPTAEPACADERALRADALAHLYCRAHLRDLEPTAEPTSVVEPTSERSRRPSSAEPTSSPPPSGEPTAEVTITTTEPPTSADRPGAHGRAHGGADLPVVERPRSLTSRDRAADGEEPRTVEPTLVCSRSFGRYSLPAGRPTTWGRSPERAHGGRASYAAVARTSAAVREPTSELWPSLRLSRRAIAEPTSEATLDRTWSGPIGAVGADERAHAEPTAERPTAVLPLRAAAECPTGARSEGTALARRDADRGAHVCRRPRRPSPERAYVPSERSRRPSRRP